MILYGARYFKHFDWISFLLTIVLSAIGLCFIFSATYKPEQPFSIFFKKQLIGLILAIILYLFISVLDYRACIHLCSYAYFAVIAFLIITIIKGSIGMGAQRWINLFLFRVQPSELTKLFFPFFMAYSFFEQKEVFPHKRTFFIPILIILAISVLLIMKQPDLGTALLLFFSALVLLWTAGMSHRWFLYGFTFFLITAPVSWHFLKTYQKKRVLVFLGKGTSKKERYHIEQSTIAIGSGNIFGKGFLQGTQNKLLFLPESRTDFIFSVIAEEMGLLGALAIVLLYLLFFFHLLSLISLFKDPFTQLLALGILLPLIFSTFINIAMVTGLLPIVGIPLPLISYGLSNLWVTYLGLGFISSMNMRRTYINC